MSNIGLSLSRETFASSSKRLAIYTPDSQIVKRKFSKIFKKFFARARANRGRLTQRYFFEDFGGEIERAEREERVVRIAARYFGEIGSEPRRDAVFLRILLIVRSNSPLSNHSARKNCSSIGAVHE